MNSQLVPILYYIVAALIGAVGQFLYKTGADRATGGFASYLQNGRLIGGVICYIAVMVLFVLAFKKGGELKVLYPIYSSTFIWAALIAYFSFGSPIKAVNVVGMVLLVGGMYLMGR